MKKSVAGFTPNLTTGQVMDLDRRRGMGDTGTFTQPEGLEAKKPWLNPDGTHKAQEDSMPLPPKREGETEFERDIRHYTNEVKDNPKKYPGGQKQAIAIAANEAGVAKKGDDGDPYNGRLEGLKKYVISSAPPPGAPKMPSAAPKTPAAPAAPSMGAKPPTPPMGAMKPPPIPGDAKGMYRSIEEDHEDEEDTEKALTTRSMYVPPPMGPYDPFGILRNGSSVPSRQIPIDTYVNSMKPMDAYKSCVVHGVSYRDSVGCPPCAIQKSSMCKTCNGQMYKTAGGTLTCPRGH